jgi:hypothetical protein
MSTVAQPCVVRTGPTQGGPEGRPCLCADEHRHTTSALQTMVASQSHYSPAEARQPAGDRTWMQTKVADLVPGQHDVLVCLYPPLSEVRVPVAAVAREMRSDQVIEMELPLPGWYAGTHAGWKAGCLAGWLVEKRASYSPAEAPEANQAMRAQRSSPQRPLQAPRQTRSPTSSLLLGSPMTLLLRWSSTTLLLHVHLPCPR